MILQYFLRHGDDPRPPWTLTMVIDTCRKYGLEINLQPGKTEAVVAFRGSEAPQWRFVAQQATISAPTASQTLRCVAQYEHLGTLFVADGGSGKLPTVQLELRTASFAGCSRDPGFVAWRGELASAFTPLSTATSICVDEVLDHWQWFLDT